MEKMEALELIAKSLLHRDISGAKNLVNAEYPFHKLESSGRTYTDKQKMQQFKKDGLTSLFVKIVNADNSLLGDLFI